MKCINESCNSTDVVVIQEPETTISNKIGNLIVTGFMLLGCLTPYHHAAGQGVKQSWGDVTKSAKIIYKCKKCGCTWSKKVVI